MFNLGMGEITIILILALIFLGPKKLPELASGLGKLIREIRKTTSDVKNEIQLDDIIRKPMEELREAMTLHPEELKRRDRMKRELEELARKASELQQAEGENPPAEGDAQEQGQADPRDVAEQAAAQASEGGHGAPSPDETTVDATGAGATAAASESPDTAGLIPGAAPAGTIARDPSAGHAPPPAPPLAAVLARGPGPQSVDKRPTAAGTDFLRSLRAVPDARRQSPSRPNPAADAAGAADRSNTTQTLTEADLAAITVGGPPPPPASPGHTGKTQPPPPPARLPGATPPKTSSNS